MIYPVITIFNDDKNVYAFDKKDAEVCSLDLIGKFNNSIFFDSNLNKYLVSKAERKSWAFFYGYHPLLKGRSVKIKFNFCHSEKVTLEDVKLFLISKLKSGVEKSFWYSKKDIPKLIDKVRDSEDFNSLVKVFSEDI